MYAPLCEAIVKLCLLGRIPNRRPGHRRSAVWRGALPIAAGVLALATAASAHAALVIGDFVLEETDENIPSVGTVQTLINSQLGTSLSLLQLTDPVLSENGSETSAFGTLTSTEIPDPDVASPMLENTVGTWTFTPTSGHIVDFILVKNDDSFAIWDLRNVAMANMGCWSTYYQDASCTDGSGTTLLSLFDDDFDGLVAFSSVVPIPAAGWLFLSALVGLWVVRRRSAANNA